MNGTTRVLVVDDELAIRRLVRRTLEAHGYAVVEAPDGQSALDLLAQGPPADLVISDAALPGISGPQLLQLCRRLYPGIRLMLVSGYIAGGLPSQDSSGGWILGLAKPFDGPTLLAMVERVMSQPA